MEKRNVMFIVVPYACGHSTWQLSCYLFSSLVETFLEYRRIRSKKYSTDYRTANSIQLIVAIKGDFSSLFIY